MSDCFQRAFCFSGKSFAGAKSRGRRKKISRKGTHASSTSPFSSSFFPSLLLPPNPAPARTNVQPQAAQVSPFLIAVSPIGASVQPQGFVHAPADINVGPVGVISSPRGKVVSPTAVNIGGKTAVDLTPPRPLGIRVGAFGRKKLLASSEEEAIAADDAAVAAANAAASSGGKAAAAADETKKLLVSDDPLDLSDEFPSDYRNWASVLSQVLLTKEPTPDKARESLKRLMLAAHGHLAKVASGEELAPRFHLQDPVLSAASSSAHFPPLPFFAPYNKAGPDAPPSSFPATSATAFSSSATFLNYAPCVLSETPTGASASVTGLNFIPSLFSINSAFLEADTAIINIQPQESWWWWFFFFFLRRSFFSIFVFSF